MKKEILRDLYLKQIVDDKILGPLTGYPSRDKPWLKYYDESALVTEVPDNISIYENIKIKNKKRPNRIAINYYGNKYTYGQMFQFIDEYASRYKSLGVKSGDIVSICMPSTPETVYSFYALNKLGAICDMIDPRSNANQMKYYLEQNKSKLVLLCENYYPTMKEVVDSIDGKIILCPITPSAPLAIKLIVDSKTKIDNFKTKYGNNTILWKEFYNLNKNIETIQEKCYDDLALIVHSSGTTSVPKGIMLTNKNVNAIAVQYSLTRLNISEGDKFLSVIPAFASFGVVASINLPLYLSMETILVPIATPDKFSKLIEKEKPNFTLTIPANFIYMMKNSKVKDLSFFYGPGCGGYSLDSSKEKEINDFLRKSNCPSPMLMGWGMSELSSTACLEIPEINKELSSGIPLPKNIISIFEPKTDKELQYYQEGEICVTGPTMMYGYLNNPKKTQNTIIKHSDGKYWLHSNDIGYMDEKGRIYPVDRIDRMIIKGLDGFKIFPQKIEDVISSVECVDSCVVVGCEGENGIYPKAFIVLKEDYLLKSNYCIQMIKEKCAEKLSIRAIPDDFEIIDKIPYTSMGKIDYKNLEESNKKEINVKKRVLRKDK